MSGDYADEGYVSLKSFVVPVLALVVMVVITIIMFGSETKLYSISGDYFATERRSDSENDCEYFIHSEAGGVEVASGTHDCGSLNWKVTLDPSNDAEIDVLVMNSNGHIGFAYPTTPNGSVYKSLSDYLKILFHLPANG